MDWNIFSLFFVWGSMVVIWCGSNKRIEMFRKEMYEREIIRSKQHENLYKMIGESLHNVQKQLNRKVDKND